MQNDTIEAIHEPENVAIESKQRNYLAAFLLTLFLGLVGANRFYTGHNLLGWVRTLLFVAIFIAPAGYLIDVTTGTTLLTAAGFMNLAAGIWWYIDLWLYYANSVTVNHTGERLQQTKYDKSVATNLIFSMHAAVILIGVLFVAAVGVLSYYSSQLLQQYQNSLPGGGFEQLQQDPEKILQQL